MTMNASVSTPDQVALKVSGMTCEGCARSIERVRPGSPAWRVPRSISILA